MGFERGIIKSLSNTLEFSMSLFDSSVSMRHEHTYCLDRLNNEIFRLETLPAGPEVDSRILQLQQQKANASKLINKDDYEGAIEQLQLNIEEIINFTDEQTELYNQQKDALEEEREQRRELLIQDTKIDALQKVYEQCFQQIKDEIGLKNILLIKEIKTDLKQAKALHDTGLEQLQNEEPKEAIKSLEQAIKLLNSAPRKYYEALERTKENDETSEIISKVDQLQMSISSSDFLDEESKRKLQKALQEWQHWALNPEKPTPKHSLEKLEKLFIKQETQKKKAYEQTQALLKNRRERLEALFLYTDATELIPIVKKIQAAEIQLGEWQFETADSLMGELDQEIAVFENNSEKKKQKELFDEKITSLTAVPNNQEFSVFEQKLVDFITQIKGTENLQCLIEQAEQIRTDFKTLVQQSESNPSEFETHLKNLQLLEVRISKLDQDRLHLNNISVNLENKDQELAKILSQVQQSLQILQDSIPEEYELGTKEIISPFSGRIQEEEAHWQMLKDSVPTENSLSLIYEIIEQLRNIEQDILSQATAFKAGKGTASLQKAQIHQLKKSIHSTYEECSSLNRELLLFDVPLNPLPQKLSQKSENTEEILELEQLFDSMKTLQEDLKTKLKEEQESFSKLQKKAQEKWNDIKNLIEELQQEIDSYQSSIIGFFHSKIVSYEEYNKIIPIFQGELDKQEPFVKIDLRSVVEESLESLEKLRKVILQAQLDYRGEESENGDLVNSVVQVKAAMETAKEKIKDNDILETRHDSLHAKFFNDISQLISDLGSILPEKSYAALTDLLVEYEKENKIAEEETAQLVDFEKQVDKLNDLLSENDDKFTEFQTYYKKIKNGIRQAEDLSEVHTMMPQAQVQLDNIEKELNDILSDGNIMQANSSQYLEKLEKNKDEEAKWEAALEAFDIEEYQRLKEAISQEQDWWQALTSTLQLLLPDKLKEVKTLRTLAIKTAKKGDYEMALFQLKDAKIRAQFHWEYPGGEKEKSDQDIQACKKLWKEKITSFENSLKQVCSGIANILKEADLSDIAQKIEQTETEIHGLFPKIAFDSIINQITMPDVEGAFIRKAVKDGLGKVRVFQERIKDPRIRYLSAHPFQKVEQFKGHFELNTALIEIEKNLLMANGRD